MEEEEITLEEYKTAEDKILKAKIKLQSRNPFFSYLSLYLKIRKADDIKILESYSMSVDIKGNIYYNPKFVNKLTDEEVIGVIAHEIGHLAFIHLTRRYNRDMDKWNIATDLAVNSMLVRNNFKLPSAGLVPNHYDEYTFKQDFFGKCITIKKISEKPAEEIYDELPDLQEQDGFSGCGGFDKHNEDDGDSEGKGKRKLTPAEIQEIEEKWKERLEEALLNSKMKGEVPLGMERLFDNIRKSVIPWRILLERVYSKAVPTDVNWLRRSKKSYACKIYLPNIIKEKVEVVNIIDTSGSISQDDLEVYISEIIGMARAYQNHIDMRIITHDCEVQDDYSIKNGNIEKIKALKIKGGGGTSHKPVFEYIKEKYKDTKIIISFTDGYSDLDDIDFNDYNFDKVFVIKNGSEEQLNNKKCKIININEK